VQEVAGAVHLGIDANIGYTTAHPDGGIWTARRLLESHARLGCLTQSSIQNRNAQQDESPMKNNKKSLPETFVSHGLYINAWVPLFLAEAQAQMVSDELSLATRRMLNLFQ
jgi:hypothetical protein